MDACTSLESPSWFREVGELKVYGTVGTASRIRGGWKVGT